MVKRKMAASSLKNLARGPRSRVPAVKKKLPDGHFKWNGKIYAHKSTSMTTSYTRHNPNPAMKTKLDELHRQSILALTRLSKARSNTDVRTVKETTMMLQFVFRFLSDEKCTLTKTVERAASIFHWQTDKIYEAVKNYLAHDEAAPNVKTPKISGRGGRIIQTTIRGPVHGS